MPNPSILIVDDEEGLQSSLATAFAAEGYRAEGAGSAGQALACLQRAPFDVLLTDLVMPGADGLVLMEQVRALYPDTVIILMTGGATVESAVRALKGGAYDYVLKPFTLVEIFHVVGQGLEQRRLRQENLQLSEINRRLQEIDEVKSNLLSAVTHEFWTPLTIMHGWLDLLLGNHFGILSSEQRESLTTVRKSAIRLGRLISNLLALVESERGQGLRRLSLIDLAEVLREIAGELQPDLAERGVPITLALDSAPALIQADGDRLRLLFFNLVENAIKFSEAGAEVQVGITREAETLEVAITNTRGDIPVERIPRLLQPFTQGDMSLSRAVGGLGLGLAVVRAVTDAHHGRLAVESGEGRGTTIRVRLPTAPPDIPRGRDLP